MGKSFSNQENFYKRLRELSDVDARAKSVSLDKQSLIEYSRANDGSALGIIKEDSSFYIKASNSKGDLAVEHFTYIGGLENKLRYKYESLAEAKKNMGFYIGSLNESLDRKYTVGILKEEKEILLQTNADKGGIATAQDKADKESKGENLKPSAQEKEIADPINKDGIAKNQAEGDKNKSDDASAKLKITHEPSTASGAARGDIAKAQSNADTITKATHSDNAPEKEIVDTIAKTGAAKNQSVGDTNKSDDASAKLKTTEPKEVNPASDAKKEKAIVAENFGEEEQEVAPELPGASAGPSPDAAASAAGSAEGIPTGGDETADLDAAASALDALDIKADADAASPDAGIPAMGGADASSAEVPSGELPTAGAEGGGENNGIDDIGGGAPADGSAGGDDAAVKDIEKLVGKTGQKIRSTELTDEMVGGFLKSIISSFDGKLSNLDSELKRELSNKILKAGEEGEESNGAAASATPDASASTSPESGSSVDAGAPEGGDDTSGLEKDVDETALAIPGDHEIEEAINQHLASMGMADQGGVGAGAEGEPTGFKKYMADRGYGAEEENISISEMVSLVSGYANECDGDPAKGDMQTIAEYLSPEVKQGVNECGYGRFTEGVSIFNIKPKSYKSAEPIAEAFNDDEEAEGEKKVDEKKDIKFAPAGQSLNKAEKEEKDAEKKDDDKEIVSESAKSKLKSIINIKIQEQLGLRKPSINESFKSTLSKKIDEMIATEIEKGRIALKEKRASK